jgi:post-GPI attachment to proteins factor 3
MSLRRVAVDAVEYPHPCTCRTGTSDLYGLYYTPIRIFRLDQGGRKAKSLLRIWTVLCIAAYTAHVTYLKWYSWDYTYNMAANVTAGIVQNILWSWFSVEKYRRLKKPWAAWPGFVVAWVLVAMGSRVVGFSTTVGMLECT